MFIRKCEELFIMLKNIAIITARGGSKRIPKKNIKNFCGKPIIAYSIEAALESGIFDEVMVSTESVEIAEIAKKYGASVPFLRSKTMSSDFANTADVLVEVINDYKLKGFNYDILACIYPTAPFVTADRLSDAMTQLMHSSADAVLSVVQYSFPPQRAFTMKDGIVRFQYPEYEKTRSQDLEPIYHDCGQFYFIKTEALLRYRSLIVPKTLPYIMKDEEVQDIDTMSDWVIAEAKYQVFHKGER